MSAYRGGNNGNPADAAHLFDPLSYEAFSFAETSESPLSRIPSDCYIPWQVTRRYTVRLVNPFPHYVRNLSKQGGSLLYKNEGISREFCV